jgi:hypothetical protein
VLTAVGEERCFVQAIVKRKKNWIGHIVRGNSLSKLVIEQRMVGKKPRGRQRMGIIDDFAEGSYPEMEEGLKIETNGAYRCQTSPKDLPNT